MNLLKIDNKLIALHLKSTTIYNITDNLTGHTIRKIICSADRFVILTATKLYYLYYNEHNFTEHNFILVDVTDDVTPTVDINDIKFITNTTLYYHFGIITYYNKGFICNIEFICEIKEFAISSVDYIFSLDNKNVVAVSNDEFGYIRDAGNDEYIVECYNFIEGVEKVGIITAIPEYFISPYTMFCGKQLVMYTCDDESYVVHRDNVSHVYGGRYYVIDGLIYCTLDLDKEHEHMNYGTNVIDGYTIIHYDCNHTIILNNKTKIVDCIKKSEEDTGTYKIGKSYYCVESFPQYSNDAWNVKWTIGGHRLFGKYTDEYVKVILGCHKYGNIRKWIPKGVLCLIIQFALYN